MSDEEEVEDLQGSSRTVGGFCRGKAVGNAPAFADLEALPVAGFQQPKGRVLLHVGESAPYYMELAVGSDLPTALNGLSDLYSPIKRHNACISVLKEGGWELKGRFHGAVQMAHALPWAEVDNGK